MSEKNNPENVVKFVTNNETKKIIFQGSVVNYLRKNGFSPYFRTVTINPKQNIPREILIQEVINSPWYFSKISSLYNVNKGTSLQMCILKYLGEVPALKGLEIGMMPNDLEANEHISSEEAKKMLSDVGNKAESSYPKKYENVSLKYSVEFSLVNSLMQTNVYVENKMYDIKNWPEIEGLSEGSNEIENQRIVNTIRKAYNSRKWIVLDKNPGSPFYEIFLLIGNVEVVFGVDNELINKL